jgi:23S rRNA (guanosine2251-2'-O)-methyltransferase
MQVILIREGTRPERAREVVDLAAERGVPVRFVAPEELAAVAHGATHGGIVAVCGPKPLATNERLLEIAERARVAARAPLFLLIEGIDDSRNLGFVLRSADAVGADAVLVKKHLWSFDSVEVSRPSSGAYERLPIALVDDLAILERLRREGLRLVGCLAGARRTIHETDLAAPTIVALGGEKRGLSGALRSICDAFATIPSRPGGPAFSLSHAAAIVLAEAQRQRLGTGDPGPTSAP